MQHVGALKLVGISVASGGTKLTIRVMSVRPFKCEVSRWYMKTPAVGGTK